MTTAITRPNGKVYRPRKIRVQVLGNEDETTGIVVLGTHDMQDARARAEAELVRDGNADVYSIAPSDPGKRVWYRQVLYGWGWDYDGPSYGYQVDEERGAAGVEFEIITDLGDDL